MKNIFKILIITLVIGFLSSCNSKDSRNYEYMPNMYRSVPYDTYGEYDNFVDGNSALIPPDGTIARGYSLFEFENNTAGYDLAKNELKSPLTSSTEVDLKTGKELYNVYCAVCHGNKGAGQGILVKREKILGIPSYSDIGRAINEGSIYHTIYYGKNSMGSYAGQLNEEERWLVTHYVLKLKSDLEN
jgi:mono/diheme cytochrome c family protein